MPEKRFLRDVLKLAFTSATGLSLMACASTGQNTHSYDKAKYNPKTGAVEHVIGSETFTKGGELISAEQEEKVYFDTSASEFVMDTHRVKMETELEITHLEGTARVVDALGVDEAVASAVNETIERDGTALNAIAENHLTGPKDQRKKDNEALENVTIRIGSTSGPRR